MRRPLPSGGAVALAAWLSAAFAAGAAAQESSRGATPDGFAWRDGRPTLTALDGNLTATPVLRLDADAVSFFAQNRPGGFRSGANLRRARVGVEGGIAGAFEYAFIWDFGGSDPNDWGAIYEAQIAYTGLGWGTVRLGAFRLQHLPDFAGSSFDLPFLERATISNLAASVASGDTRVALGLEARGERWVGSLYLTNGVLSERNDRSQRGAVGRLAVLALDRPDAQLQLGFNAAWRFETGGASFGDYPEARVDTRQFLDTGTLRADATHAVGPEAIARLGPLVVEAVWQRLGADAPAENGGGGGAKRFEGWYVQAIHPLLGPGRRRDARTGVWRRPDVADEPLDLAAGRIGALELAGRYSTADLRDGAATRGGRQRIWTAALNWFPRRDLKITAQVANGAVDLDGRDHDFQAFGLRIAFNL